MLVHDKEILVCWKMQLTMLCVGPPLTQAPSFAHLWIKTVGSTSVSSMSQWLLIRHNDVKMSCSFLPVGCKLLGHYLQNNIDCYHSVLSVSVCVSECQNYITACRHLRVYVTEKNWRLLIFPLKTSQKRLYRNKQDCTELACAALLLTMERRNQNPG